MQWRREKSRPARNGTTGFCYVIHFTGRPTYRLGWLSVALYNCFREVPSSILHLQFHSVSFLKEVEQISFILFVHVSRNFNPCHASYEISRLDLDKSGLEISERKESISRHLHLNHLCRHITN
jgi:hypothetical protein